MKRFFLKIKASKVSLLLNIVYTMIKISKTTFLSKLRLLRETKSVQPSVTYLELLVKRMNFMKCITPLEHLLLLLANFNSKECRVYH